jgi:tetratricopeptide (TPR) repeat protein
VGISVKYWSKSADETRRRGKEKTLDSALTLNTVDRAEQVLLEGDFGGALGLVRQLYGQMLPSSDRGRALAIEIVCLERLGKSEESDRLVAEMMKQEGDDHAYVLAAGIQFSDLDAHLHAEVFLRNLCEINPSSDVAWYNLAIALGREDRFVEAVQAYDRCIALTPGLGDAYRQKAYCQEMLDDTKGASETYRRYLEMHPDDAEVWKALGIVESDRRRFAEAYDAFRHAVELSSEPEDVYYNWAITAVRNSDVEQQRLCIDRLQDIDPEGWRTLLTRADQEEVEKNVWPAWELLCEAFENSLVGETEDESEEDEDVRGYITAALLRFAYRNDLREHAQDYILRIFEERLFSEEVLEALQAFDGRFSNTATSYQVVVKRIAEEDAAYVVYGVAANDADEAGRIARSFEERCVPGAETSLYAIHQLNMPDEGRLGVYWRSDEFDRPPGA